MVPNVAGCAVTPCAWSAHAGIGSAHMVMAASERNATESVSRRTGLLGLRRPGVGRDIVIWPHHTPQNSPCHIDGSKLKADFGRRCGHSVAMVEFTSTENSVFVRTRQELAGLAGDPVGDEAHPLARGHIDPAKSS